MIAPRKNFARRLRLRSGFTLLELTLALAMVACVAGALYGPLQAGLRSQQSAELALEPARTAEVSMEFLRQDIQNILPPNTAVSGALVGSFLGTNGSDGRGADADDVVFYTTAEAPDDPTANGDVKKVELAVTTEQGSNQQVLVRRITRDLLAEIEPEPQEEVICRGLTGFNVRYFDGTNWEDTWDSTLLGDTIPFAIEVTIQLNRPGGTNEPERVLRFVRIFNVSCAIPVPDTGLNL